MDTVSVKVLSDLMQGSEKGREQGHIFPCTIVPPLRQEDQVSEPPLSVFVYGLIQLNSE